MNIRNSLKNQKLMALLLSSSIMLNISSTCVFASEQLNEEVYVGGEVTVPKNGEIQQEEISQENNQNKENNGDDANTIKDSNLEGEAEKNYTEGVEKNENVIGKSVEENLEENNGEDVSEENIEEKRQDSIEGKNESRWALIDGKWYYFNDHGVKATGWQLIEETWYYLNESGVMQTGWINLEGTWYYLRENGAMQIGWINVDGTWFYLRDNGAMHIGWINLEGTWYYLRENGAMQVGWINIDGRWYYLRENGAMQTGWVNLEGPWYYFNQSGAMQTGWQKINGQMYYLNEYGRMEKGWLYNEGNWYYLQDNGAMFSSGIKVIENNKYYFHNDGKMASDFWFGTSYAKSNGIVIDYTDSMSHSSTQYNLFKYMLDEANQESVHKRAIQLHNGITSNNCVYFSSEALRRVGVNIPTKTSYTTNFEKELTKLGWKKSTNLNDVRPGDVVFAGTAHAYIFMGWAEDGYAYVVDNQKDKFGTVFHKRNVKKYNAEFDTDPSTHFYYLPR